MKANKSMESCSYIMKTLHYTIGPPRLFAISQKHKQTQVDHEEIGSHVAHLRLQTFKICVILFIGLGVNVLENRAFIQMETFSAAVRLGVEPVYQKTSLLEECRVSIQAVRSKAAGEIVDDNLGRCIQQINVTMHIQIR